MEFELAEVIEPALVVVDDPPPTDTLAERQIERQRVSPDWHWLHDGRVVVV